MIPNPMPDQTHSQQGTGSPKNEGRLAGAFQAAVIQYSQKQCQIERWKECRKVQVECQNICQEESKKIASWNARFNAKKIAKQNVRTVGGVVLGVLFLRRFLVSESLVI